MIEWKIQQKKNKEPHKYAVYSVQCTHQIKSTENAMKK